MLTRPTVRTVAADLARPKADSANFRVGLIAAVGNVLFPDNHTDLDEQFHGQPIVRVGARIDHGEHLWIQRGDRRRAARPG